MHGRTAISKVLNSFCNRESSNKQTINGITSFRTFRIVHEKGKSSSHENIWSPGIIALLDVQAVTRLYVLFEVCIQLCCANTINMRSSKYPAR